MYRKGKGGKKRAQSTEGILPAVVDGEVNAEAGLKKSELEALEIKALEQRIGEETPSRGFQGESNGTLRFESMPLSTKTQQGLRDAGLLVATEIQVRIYFTVSVNSTIFRQVSILYISITLFLPFPQAAAIPHALAGRDVLGAAKTGSGKTLAFTLPIIERLYRERWSPEDGLAAIIVTPTRELALQIFDVLRQVAKGHSFSAGMVTGGKKEFEGEQERIVMMNILIATPGRLLQHFEQTVGFHAENLLMLVLDEADRILDMGFKQQLDGILSYLPQRQTLLFSATQTKSVKDLARLSLSSPEYLAVHSKDEEATPKQLVQNYVVCKLPDKLDMLYSFIKAHLKNKLMVFFSTCAQVRFVYECFRSMQPGIVLSALHGKIKQEKRTLIFKDFGRRKSACMFATDIAARYYWCILM